MPYMVLPYVLLALLTSGYLIYRSHKTGPVTFRVKYILLNRANMDIFLSVLLVCALCAIFLWSDLKRFNEFADLSSRWVYGSRIVFYVLLVAVFLARQLERPALREKGISSSRWFWTWDRIKTYRWNGSLLEFQIGNSKRMVSETWAVAAEQKPELDRILRLKINKVEKKKKKSKSARR